MIYFNLLQIIPYNQLNIKIISKMFFLWWRDGIANICSVQLFLVTHLPIAQVKLSLKFCLVVHV